MFDFIKKMFNNEADETLVQAIQNGAFLVDVRSPQEYAEGHVKGSVNIPVGDIMNYLSKFKGKENIVVFCRSGNRSSMAKSILEAKGFQNVINGGTWQEVNAIKETKE